MPMQVERSAVDTGHPLLTCMSGMLSKVEVALKLSKNMLLTTEKLQQVPKSIFLHLPGFVVINLEPEKAVRRVKKNSAFGRLTPGVTMGDSHNVNTQSVSNDAVCAHMCTAHRLCAIF